MYIQDPKTKEPPKLNEKYVQKAEKALESVHYPIIINIGRHLMNSYTQDYIENEIRKTGYYQVTRRLSNCGKYEVLEVMYNYET
jgi:hypothetical protein